MCALILLHPWTHIECLSLSEDISINEAGYLYHDIQSHIPLILDTINRDLHKRCLVDTLDLTVCVFTLACLCTFLYDGNIRFLGLRVKIRPWPLMWKSHWQVLWLCQCYRLYRSAFLNLSNPVEPGFKLPLGFVCPVSTQPPALSFHPHSRISHQKKKLSSSSCVIFPHSFRSFTLFVISVVVYLSCLIITACFKVLWNLSYTIIFLSYKECLQISLKPAFISFFFLRYDID